MMVAHTSSIEKSAPHVFQSVLPVLPTKSLLAQSYTNSLDSHVILHTELESNWTSYLMTLIGHSGQVRSVAFSPDGGLDAKRSVEETSVVLGGRTIIKLKTLGGHSHWMTSSACSAGGWLVL